MKQPSRRNIELVLLVFAWALGVFGTMQVGWASGEGMTQRLWITVGVVGVLALLMHVVVRWKATYADPILLPTTTLLTILGLVMIYRIDVAAAQRAERNAAPLPTPDVYAQLTWFSIAVILFIAVLVLVPDHRRLQRFTYTFGLVGLLGAELAVLHLAGDFVDHRNAPAVRAAAADAPHACAPHACRRSVGPCGHRRQPGSCRQRRARR